MDDFSEMMAKSLDREREMHKNMAEAGERREYERQYPFQVHYFGLKADSTLEDCGTDRLCFLPEPGMVFKFGEGPISAIVDSLVYETDSKCHQVILLFNAD